MSYKGKVRNGVVEFEDGVPPPDGTPVEIRLLPAAAESDDDGSLADELLRLAGACKDLPSDLARNHDHYLYGAPKR